MFSILNYNFETYEIKSMASSMEVKPVMRMKLLSRRVIKPSKEMKIYPMSMIQFEILTNSVKNETVEITFKNREKISINLHF